MFQNTHAFLKSLLNTFLFSLITLGLLTQTTTANDLLEVDKAFKLETPFVKNQHVIIQWEIADDYYLYRDKIVITSKNLNTESAIYSKSERVDDPLFGKTDVYTESAKIQIPYTDDQAQQTIELSIKYQGCAAIIGVCYPPQTQKFKVDLPAVTANSAADSETEESGFGALAALNNLFKSNTSQPTLLDADKAFEFSHQINRSGQLELNWQVANDYHLYQDKFKATVIEGNATIGEIDLPKATTVDDPVFGIKDVYQGPFSATLPIASITGSATIEIEFQGCSASAGVCYPPMKKALVVTEESIQEASQTTNNQTTSTQKSTATSNNNSELSESDRIADTLKNNSLWIVIVTFFVFGLLLSLTPCVFPMIPILSSIIVGQGHHLTTSRAFTMSLVYVLAMAMTYTVAGVLAGLFGENLQATFQNPWIIATFSFIFILLALSMFGFYELQLPARLQSKLTHYSNQQKGGTLTGVAIMGFLSALIVGPCMAPPLAGALIYIGQTGDALLGGTALFAMSMGMGLPLLIIGTSSAKFMPRAGAWMDNVKAVFGVMLIGVAIWMMERIVPVEVTMINWALLFIVSAVYMGAFETTHEKSGWFKLSKGLGLALFLYGLLILIGLLGGSKDIYQPLKTFQGSASAGQTQNEHLNFKTIKSIQDLENELAKGQPVMLDFYADWCISCKEMERLTFTDSKVHQALEGVTLLQSDVTLNDEVDKLLMKKFGLIGPPAILFFDAQGVEQKGQRVIGFKSSEDFVINIQKALP